MIGAEWSQFEAAFRQTVVGSENPLLEQVWTYITAKRGKQIRPLLVLLSAAIARSVTSKTIDTAVAMELLHTASLVHDDVVDHSPTRHGQQAVQEVWTNKIAVLSGDYLLARVIGQTAKLRNQRILQIVAQLGQDLSNGELLQIHAGESMWITREQYYRVIEKKTAVLFAACTEAGAESAGASEKAVNALRRFGLELGICFQIMDDILDYSDNEIGKSHLQDYQDGKVTLPLLIAAERAGQQPEGLTAEEVHDFVLRYDGIGGARREMEAHKKSAMQALTVFAHNDQLPYRRALEDILELSCNRIA